MKLENIDILNFKNIGECRLDFSKGVNSLLGLNGMGKSNLLEAVYFLSMARPWHTLPENSLIRHGEDMLMVKGSYSSDNGGEETISCGIVKGKGKTLKRNGKEYRRISEHIGRFPIVTVLPSDSELITGSGEQRRKLMDIVISQSDSLYLSHLIRYGRGLDSRNKMLRAGVRDSLLYESIESGMSQAAEGIYSARRAWIESIRPSFEKYYSRISGDAEEAGIRYKSCLDEATMPEILEASRAKDTILGFTSQGVHRDDFSTLLGDYGIRRLGSQGQIKSYTTALKFAIFDYLRGKGGVTPILLLDDIFDKLDSQRVSNIMRVVSEGNNFGQIFITDTNREHLDETIASIGGESRMFEVKAGSFEVIYDR